MHSYVRFNRRLAKQYYRWMVAMHYAQVTQYVYGKIIKNYVEFMGTRSIAEANHEDIRRYIAHISEKGASLDAVHKELGTLRLFYDFLHLGGVVHYVAPRFVKLRRPWMERPAPLSKSQVQRLLAAARTLRERALIEFLYGTGCRLSETAQLKAEDIDFDAKIAMVLGKLGKKRIVLLTQSAVEALRAYLDGRKSGIVFQKDLPIQKGCVTIHNHKWYSLWTEYRKRGEKGYRRRKLLGGTDQLSAQEARSKHKALMATRHLIRPFRSVALSKMAIQEMVRRISDRAGLRRVSPHTLRRTFATHLFENGAGMEIVQTLLGHAWISTTMKYVRVGVDRLAKDYEQCHPRATFNDKSPQ
jgi:site-specific recombinase XerD